jgi:CheY-like chemotaxis protein
MTSRAGGQSLNGLQVFVVEDERLISMMLEMMLGDLGCVVAGVAATVDAALARVKAAQGIDAAILDVNIGGEKVFAVAEALLERGVPFVFSTGCGPADLAERYPNSRLLNKPYSPEQLARVLAAVTQEAA